MTACDPYIKTIFFGTNMLFALVGLSLIIVGAYFTSSSTSFSDISGSAGHEIRTPQILAIVLGIVIFFVSGSGCNGALRENRTMLIVYIFCIVVIFVSQTGIGTYVLVYKTTFAETAEKDLNDLFLDFRSDARIKQLFSKMERDMECCGINHPKDYIVSLLSIPKSCCEDRNDCTIIQQSFWKQGCVEAIYNFANDSSFALGLTSIVLSVVEFVSAFFAFKLAYMRPEAMSPPQIPDTI